MWSTEVSLGWGGGDRVGYSVHLRQVQTGNAQHSTIINIHSAS